MYNISVCALQACVYVCTHSQRRITDGAKHEPAPGLQITTGPKPQVAVLLCLITTEELRTNKAHYDFSTD